MKITLTPGQAVSVHGWWRARESLTWGDVLSNEQLSFKKLLDYNLREQDLFLLQPDIQSWIKAGKITLDDFPRLKLWGGNPIRDFKADLADMARMQWSVDTLLRMDVGYQDLVDLGLIPETMVLFNYTLAMWASLGFRRVHAENTANHILFKLFTMTKQDVMAALK